MESETSKYQDEFKAVLERVKYYMLTNELKSSKIASP